MVGTKPRRLPDARAPRHQRSAAIGSAHRTRVTARSSTGALRSPRAQLGQALAHGAAATRQAALGRERAQRGEHEHALLETRMRQHESRTLELEVAVEEQVEVQRARAVALLAEALAAELGL